ncbi:MAG: ArgE/DapE family deacylase [Thermomicrobiales bacterium]
MTRDLDRQIESRRDEAIGLLQRLVAVPSITGDEGGVQDAIEPEMQRRGLEVDRWEMTVEEIAPYRWHVGDETRFAGRPNLAGTLKGEGDGRSILLNAHVDTVDYGDAALWTYPPLSGHVDGDRLYGRGSCDMKGGLVSYLIALDALAALGLRLAGTVTVNTTVGEEDGGVGALSTILRGHRADAALITEPTRLALVPAQGGSLVMRLTVPGKSAHGAVRDEGVSAIEKFIPIFQDLLAWEAERNRTLDHPLYAHLTNKAPFSIGVVRAGTWASTVAESLVAEGRLGLVPGEDVDEFRRAVEDRIRGVAREDAWLRDHPPTVDWFGGQFAPAETPVDAPISRAVIDAHQAVTGEEPVIEGVPYGADMRLFTLLGGMDCVMYGAGDVRVAHHTDEYISITELMTATKTIANLLVDWCGVAE